MPRADWQDKFWQGTLKVVERGEETAMLLVNSNVESNIFAVCPITPFLQNRMAWIDVLTARGNLCCGFRMPRGDTCFGLVFNEQNDAFDFNTVLEDSRREKEVEKQMANGEVLTSSGSSVDYKMKEGEEI